ncbi:hypothetical protein [Treponema denticola]|uniref:hypothetical protein n=1 Tax=Treponema denticola TaxID=158 RepID=UPI0020A61323|nr:hypothetical protein [Treponema denticola]UTC84013.1 hypothetical protein HGJ18_12765 [Treponema denticola]
MKFIRYIFILIPLIFIGFTSCNDRPIFAAIEQEIDLKEFSVGGNVLSLVATDTMVYASNRAGVYSKSKNSDGSWQKILTAEGTQYLAKNAANVFASFATGPVKFYDESTKTWADVPNSENIRIIAGNSIVFGYDNSQEKIYKITNASITSINIVDSSSQPVKVKDLISAAGKYFLADVGGSIKLYDNAGTEKTGLPSGAKAICPAGADDKIFVLAGSTVYYFAGGNWDNKISISGNPDNISYFEARKTILLGCAKGYTEVQLDNVHTTDLSKAKQLNPGAEGSTTPPGSYSQYQTTLGSYYTYPVLGVERGNAGSGKYAVFMGIYSGTITRNTGLWGFYSDKKREWNRE